MTTHRFTRMALSAMGAALFVAPAFAEFALQDSYAVPGAEIKGKFNADRDEPAVLRISALAETDVPTKLGVPAQETEILKRDVAGGDGVDFAFAVPKTMLEGRIRFRAVATTKNGAPLFKETSAPVAVAIRKRVNLNGEWQISKVEPFPVVREGGEMQIDASALPSVFSIPGTLSRDAGWPNGFRGWVTFKRNVSLPANAAAIAFSAEGVADSAALRVNGADVAEMLPEEDLDSSLSSWFYFHGERLYPGVKNREDTKRLVRLLADRDVLREGLQTIVPNVAGASADIELTLRATSGSTHGQPPYGIHGDVSFSPLPATYVEGATFDTSKPGDQRLFTFSVKLANSGTKPFKGKLRAVYGQYEGEVPYTGACPAVDEASLDVTVPPGGCEVQVERLENPRFATCRATFVLQDGGKAVDAATVNYHTVTVEIRDRRDMYVNNERFFPKGRGSSSASPNRVWQFLANGTNMRRGIDSSDWPRFPGLRSRAAYADAQLPAGILFDTGPVLASCEKCTFWNPDDPSNVERAVRYQILTLKDCPGVIQWEATNELFGEPEEARVLICDLFRKLDPYHRPVVMTKGGGEWESLAEDGTVSGPDIVGIQYLGTREAIDTLTATITEKPIQSTEINWNDPILHRDGLWRYGLDHGVCGMLLFDYSGNSTEQAVTAVPPQNLLPEEWDVITRGQRQMYLDIECTARRLPDGRIAVRFANRMPFVLRNVTLEVQYGAVTHLDELASGDACEIAVPATAARYIPGEQPMQLVTRAKYTTHGGLKNDCVMTAELQR